MKTNDLIRITSLAAIGGNILFVLWITYNGIDEGFSGTLIEKLSYAALVILLTTNSILLIASRRKYTQHV